MPEQSDKTEAVESRLLPILREGIAVVRMIFFLRLKEVLAATQPALESTIIPRLAGVVLNELFGTVNPDPAWAAFREQHLALIEQTLADMPRTMTAMCIPVSDALRMAALCDFQESGQDSTAVLARARDLGILLQDRELPLPHRFLDLARRLGKAQGLIVPPSADRC
jgi:hypothetical protein